MIAKPSRIFARDVEWRALADFVAYRNNRPRLGVVSGRRRQGKTYLLESLARESGGFYFGATQATEAESLLLFTTALGRYLGASAPPRLNGWDETIRYLFSEFPKGAGPVVIDEFPYLSAMSPALPSILQREIDQGVMKETDISLLLCGSAISVMGRILAGNAPLRGRANLELIIRSFEYPKAAEFWQVEDPKLAVLLNAVVGGTPAYRQFVGDRSPKSVAKFSEWLVRTVLNPATPLFREARYLLEEDGSQMRDAALYHSVLGAVASGNHTRGGIASYIGRRSADIGHHLNVLEDSGLLRRESDMFNSGRAYYRIAEPLITFYHVVMRSQWGVLESGHAETVWQGAKARFQSQVVGPHFERLCREFALFAPPETFGGLPGEVGSGVISDPKERKQIEVDVAVFAPGYPEERRKVLSLGEAKWGEVITERHVNRLRRARDLLDARGFDVANTVLTCYSGAGFDPGLSGKFGSDRVLTVGLDQLYGDV